VAAAGVVRCWGTNTLGELGDGTITNRTSPVTVSGLTNAATVTAGSGHTCALRADGTARCWGDNQFGQLGDGTVTQRATPAGVIGLTNALAVTAGGGHTCALQADGALRCWGLNVVGELGDGTSGGTSRTPIVVAGSVAGISGRDVAAGAGYSCAARASGAAACWGLNRNGELGDGTTARRLAPVEVDVLTDTVAIATGHFSHSCAVRADGEVHCWSVNSNGQLGDGSITLRLSPTPVSGMDAAVAVAAGQNHTCMLRGDGVTRCWGGNFSGQLGDLMTSHRFGLDTASGFR